VHAPFISIQLLKKIEPFPAVSILLCILNFNSAKCSHFSYIWRGKKKGGGGGGENDKGRMKGGVTHILVNMHD
jgi:hypothetical protein